MNEKICKEDIQNILCREYGMSELESSEALNTFFSLIVKALEKERYVRIKGLGIFKLVDVETRRGVDVNTGESIEIPSHRRISFSVDSDLKDLINKPFSCFETVVLKEGVLLDDVFQGIENETEWQKQNSDSESDDSFKDELMLEDGVEVIEEQMFMAMDEGCKEEVREIQPLLGCEDLYKRELVMEKEERNNRIAMAIVVALMALVLLGGLVFMLAPEWIEECLYSL